MCMTCRKIRRQGSPFWAPWWAGVAGTVAAVAGHGWVAALTGAGLAGGLAALLALRPRWTCTHPAAGERVSHVYCLECFEAEMHNMAHGHDCIPNPLSTEIDNLKKVEFVKKWDLVHCKECNGRGRIIIDVGFRSSSSQCWKCGGSGRHFS